MNLQAKSAASPFCIYGYSYQYRSNGVFEAGCRQVATAARAGGGRAMLATQPNGAVLEAEIASGMKALEAMLGQEAQASSN